MPVLRALQIKRVGAHHFRNFSLPHHRVRAEFVDYVPSSPRFSQQAPGLLGWDVGDVGDCLDATFAAKGLKMACLVLSENIPSCPRFLEAQVAQSRVVIGTMPEKPAIFAI